MIDTKQVELKSKALTDFQFSMKHYLTHFNYAKVTINGEKIFNTFLIGKGKRAEPR